eukprot:3287264-Pyramimonas_sp.AAC.1
MDVANRQVALSGFSTALSLDSRTNEIEEYLRRFQNVSAVSVGHFMQGPRNAQTATKVSYIEFSSEVSRNKFLESAKSIVFKSATGNITVRPAKTKYQKH